MPKQRDPLAETQGRSAQPTCSGPAWSVQQRGRRSRMSRRCLGERERASRLISTPAQLREARECQPGDPAQYQPGPSSHAERTLVRVINEPCGWPDDSAAKCRKLFRGASRAGEEVPVREDGGRGIEDLWWQRADRYIAPCQKTAGPGSGKNGGPGHRARPPRPRLLLLAGRMLPQTRYVYRIASSSLVMRLTLGSFTSDQAQGHA